MPKAYADPYSVLGLEHSATGAEIKQAYFALVRAHPPEREPDVFKRIRAAYEQLREPERRLEADMLLLEPWPEPARRRKRLSIDLKLHAEDVIAAARALTDLDRHDWREQFTKIEL